MVRERGLVTSKGKVFATRSGTQASLELGSSFVPGSWRFLGLDSMFESGLISLAG